MKKYLGLILIFLITINTVNLWINSKSSFVEIINSPLRSFSQILALEGIILMSLSLVLATRIHLIEDIFAGIDQVYKIHKIMGIVAFLFLINHPLLLATQSLPNLKAASAYLIPGKMPAYNLGIAALYIMILSFIFMIFIKLPFHLWRNTHRFLGLSFMLGGVHGFLVRSDLSGFIYLKIWMLSFIFTGSLAFIYSIFFYKKFGQRFIYKVEKVERVLDVVHIYLLHVFKKMTFQPGQFIYIWFDNKTLGKEEHPFSISSASTDASLRISAKIVGDYTLRLPNLRTGDLAYVYGPHGKFGEKSITHESAEVWIAGGIGVTPFMSMIRQNFFNKNTKPIDFIYSFSNPEEAIFKDEIEDNLTAGTNIRCTLWCTKDKGRLTVNKILNLTGNLEGKCIYLCGPETMMMSLKDQFLRTGVEENRILFERFEHL